MFIFFIIFWDLVKRHAVYVRSWKESPMLERDGASAPRIAPRIPTWNPSLWSHFNGCDGGGDRCHIHPSNCAQGLPIQTLPATVSQELALSSDPGRLQQTLVQGTKRAWDSHNFTSPREHFWYLPDLISVLRLGLRTPSLPFSSI